MKLKHISVRELCRITGIPRQSLYNIKQGTSQNPSFNMILKIAETLNVSLDEFRGDKRATRSAQQSNCIK
ncbi:MAG TPA: XRE family transcriptional regulator [Lactobacillus sp.]|nr:XRE family transcriptional regulator [Lactobacillus sp.]